MSQPVAVVTGASSGMGLAVTKHLVAKGWRVAMADIDADSGRKVAAEIGDQVLFCRTDVTSYPQQASLFETAFAWGGDRLGLPTRNSSTTTITVIQGVWLFKHYARRNKVAGGKVVITSSSAGLYPMESNPIYTASKHALVGLTRALGPVLQRQNIQVNAICPAFVPTGLCPKEMLGRFPKEHMIPSSKTMAFLDRLWN
ncbi:hypothetical protein KXX57_001128 [Aspergillus fumigatus]|nr:hypothetical protein KXX57_001128 [Aspergillus fumigatus]